MELNIVKPGNDAAGKVSVSDVAFAREFNEDLVHQVVTAYMAGARQGTRAQKNRSDVRAQLWTAALQEPVEKTTSDDQRHEVEDANAPHRATKEQL